MGEDNDMATVVPRGPTQGAAAAASSSEGDVISVVSTSPDEPEESSADAAQRDLHERAMEALQYFLSNGNGEDKNSPCPEVQVDQSRTTGTTPSYPYPMQMKPPTASSAENQAKSEKAFLEEFSNKTAKIRNKFENLKAETVPEQEAFLELIKGFHDIQKVLDSADAANAVGEVKRGIGFTKSCLDRAWSILQEFGMHVDEERLNASYERLFGDADATPEMVKKAMEERMKTLQEQRDRSTTAMRDKVGDHGKNKESASSSSGHQETPAPARAAYSSVSASSPSSSSSGVLSGFG
ncbi:unnamed protein product, partial [Amoebophrya sp. A120]|eukprot:GSA120T00010045001.1